VPIISPIGRKHWKVRALIYSIYFVLTLGAVSMLYPFFLILAGSTKSAVDEKEFTMVPTFLRGGESGDQRLYQKYVEGLFNERLDRMEATYDVDASSFETIEAPTETREAFVDAWENFTEQGELASSNYALGFLYTPLSRTQPAQFRAFKRRLLATHGDNIVDLNKALGMEFVNWNAFIVTPEYYLPRRNALQTSAFYEELRSFKAEQGAHLRCWFNVEGFYKSYFLRTQYPGGIAGYNESHGTAHASWDEVRLPRSFPADGTEAEQKDWEDFMRNVVNLRWLRVGSEAAPDWQAFLQAKNGTVEILNRLHGSNWGAFEEVTLPATPPTDGVLLSDWTAFLAGWRAADGTELRCPVEAIRVHSTEGLFRDWLRMQHGSIANANQALGSGFASWDVVRPPQRESHYRAFQSRRGEIKREFMFRNYIAVWEYLVLHGRGVLNTAIYCLLAVLIALLVNPLAAYALSRYRPASTYKLLLFMLLTMAFPPMVTQIPIFLMLRDLKLLNTFAALILPGMAHGYSIFLLKGFFDSLPRELYESAEMDGAGEWTMFWTITMSLSKPILAVIALNAFVSAYGNFMFALLICQDERMWTLMVWLYQLQQRSGEGVIYASLLLAAIPTFILFAFCQNIIMRGIVVPVEK